MLRSGLIGDAAGGQTWRPTDCGVFGLVVALMSLQRDLNDMLF